MKALGLRIALSLAVTILIGLLFLDIAYLFWGESQAATKRRQSMQLAGLAAQVESQRLRTDFGTRISRIASDHRVTLSMVHQDGSLFQTSPVELPAISASNQFVRVQKYEHLMLLIHQHPNWRRVIVSRDVTDAMSLVWESHSKVTAWLFGVGALMLLLGILLLRSAVVKPLRGMIERMRQRAGDTHHLSSTSGDDLSELRLAILDMTQTIHTDRERIASQYAELSEAHTSLETAQQQLIRAARLGAVGQLAAGLAHEIGNPLAILSGYTEVLAGDDVPDPERDRILSSMERELDRIQRTVRELLDFSRMPEEEIGMGRVSEALEHLQSLLGPQERFKRLQVEFDNAAGDAKVPLDVQRVTQIVLNLAFNAADAAGESGRIRITAGQRGETCFISVEDSGAGVPPEVAEHIFEPFFTTKEPGKGTGLGLSVCERMVAAVGGDIALSKSELGGACFTVTLPLAGVAVEHTEGE
jgi:signal transduction histidine kinase